MENDEAVKSDETRTFLQEGFHSYAPALVAVSEFRRLISLKLQGVLDESATRLSDLGLGIDSGLKLKRLQLDDVDLSLNAGSVELEKIVNARFYTNYHVTWQTDGPKEKQVRVGVWVWTDKKEKRNNDSCYTYSPVKSELHNSEFHTRRNCAIRWRPVSSL